MLELAKEDEEGPEDDEEGAALSCARAEGREDNAEAKLMGVPKEALETDDAEDEAAVGLGSRMNEVEVDPKEVSQGGRGSQ